ncbi:DNA binding protein [Microbacterium phage Vitas]|uniref:DNA binding protein n=2 Tax=Armstrongvirus armstrong TaxID=2734217 RepID=A0A5B8WJU8_9CAUD|nr:DNA binding protein [Microbacterium phage Vitas]UGL62010.1 DNA binding protein [Microbacterium phage Skylord]UOK18197.1 DNA binding protein [Microbacterium phage Clayda5]
MDELFKMKAGRESLDITEERRLIEAAQAGDGDAVWALLIQYRGLLQKTANNVRSRVRGMAPDKVEDLQADLVLAAVEGIKAFELEKFTRLSQTLPGRLKDVALEMTTALTVPRGTLALWFKVWRAAEQDFREAERLAPGMGMTAGTFRAIQHALEHVDSEWVHVPYDAGVPTADEETYRLAHHALSLLSPAERDVIELVYGFRGQPKTDQEVADIREASPRTIKEQRQKALTKMRRELVEA